MISKTRNNIKSNIKRSYIISLLPLILYFYVGPLAVYNANAKSFDFHYTDFFFQIAAIGTLIYFIGGFIISLLPEIINKIICLFIFYLGIMSYIQDLFLNEKMSENDGSQIRWDEMQSLITKNTIIWCAAFALIVILFILLRKYFDKISIYSSLFISAMQIITFVTLLLSAISVANNDKEKQNYGLTGEMQYNVATNNNIIVFVIDSYGTTQLEDGLKNNPDLLASLKDFTYYDNADSCYFGTFPSMSHMLTGEDVDFELSEPDYLDKAWTNSKSNHFYSKLHDKNFTVNLFSNGGGEVYGNIENLNGKIDNANPVEYKVNSKTAMMRMTKISFFKYVPYIIKPKFEVPTYLFAFLAEYDGAASINCGNSMYYSGLKDNGLSIDESMENALIIQHLDGTHLPNDTGANGEYKDGASLQDTQEGILFILGEYINKLKELDLYDSSTIIITADHGRWDVFDSCDDPQIVYFIKTPGQCQSTISTSSAPISHDDFMATIMDLVGEKYDEYGRSILDINENEKRERTLVNREVSNEHPIVAGEACNVYAVYTYTGNKDTLVDKARNIGPDNIYEIIGW